MNFPFTTCYLASLELGCSPEAAAIYARLDVAGCDEYPLAVDLWAALDQGDPELADALCEAWMPVRGSR